MSAVAFCGFAQKTLIYCGKLIDAKSRGVQSRMTLVIEGDRIVAVENGFIAGSTGETIIDLGNKTVFPGLIDLHVHLESETNRDQALQKFTLNEADIAFRASGFARKTLMAGFTTVRDLGGSGVNRAPQCDQSAAGSRPPDLYRRKSYRHHRRACGPFQRLPEGADGGPGPREGVVNSPEEARMAVRQRYKDGVPS